MANTTIQLKSSGVTGNIPVTLQPGELAINYADGKIFYGNESNNPVLFDVITDPAGLNGEIQFNDLGTFGASSNLAFDKDTGFLTVYGLNSTSNVDAQNVIAHHQFYAGIATESATPLPNLIAQFTSNSALYTQVNQQNINPDGSADFVITADVGSDTDFYTDVGMGGSTYSYYDGENTPFEPLTGYFLVQGSTIGQTGGNMVLGTTANNTNIKVIAGGYLTDNVVATITNDGFTFEKDVAVVGNLTGNTITALQSYANSAFNKANSALPNTTATLDGTLSVTGELKSIQSIGDEGGQISLATAQTNQTLSGGFVNIDIYQNKLRFFENTGSNRGVFIDLSSAGAGVSTDLLAAGSYPQSAFDQANSAFNRANSAFAAANNVAPQIAPAFDQANAAFTVANAALSTSGGTVTGNVTVSENLEVGGYISLNTSSSLPAPKVEGTLFYDKEQHALGYYNESDMTFQIGQEEVVRVWNNSGSTINEGSVVYFTAESSGGFPGIGLARADDYETSFVAGVATTTISNGGFGYVTQRGKVNGLDTHLYSVGSELYLSATVAGTFQSTPPSLPALAFSVGRVVTSDTTNGIIQVYPAAEYPANFPTGAIFIAVNGTISQDEHLFFDTVNHRLGINTQTPQANLHVAGDALFTGNVEIHGNLVISNAQSIATTTLTVGGNTIVLNDTTTGTPTSNAEIRVNRGNQANVYIKWDEQIEEWIMYEAGSYASGHILHSEKIAKTWEEYGSFPAYEKLTHPIGAELSNTINELAKTANNTAYTALSIATEAFVQANAGFNQANTGVTIATGAFTKANTVGNTAAAAFSQANNGVTIATGAFNQANAAFNKVNALSTSITTTNIVADTITANSYVNINSVATNMSTTVTTGASPTTLFSWSASTYRTAKCIIQMNASSNGLHATEMLITHDGTNTFVVQYGDLKSNNDLGFIDASISTGTVSLILTPTYTGTIVKAFITLIAS